MSRFPSFPRTPGARRKAPTLSALRRLPWPVTLAVLVVIAVLHILSEAGLVTLPDLAEQAPDQPITARFTHCSTTPAPDCVVDGDTIRYRDAPIRLADIDAPETRDAQCPAEAALGARATQRLLELVNQAPFTLARSGSRDADRYGRKLRVLERDGRSLGMILVSEGLARPWDGARRGWC